ncbi:MAG: RNA methyltransferase [Termitinemataceae bacterium]|nr:MAG: RNA methyltransferase [Termitinemataceae bacterium]
MFNRLVDELAVCGFNAVRSVADFHPDTINRFFMTADRLPQFTDLCHDLSERKRPYKICDAQELEKICKTTHHQGVVAMVREPEPVPLSREDLLQWAEEAATGIVLHSVGNDHNLGAIIRSAAFFDAKYAVISELDEYARLTTAAYRVAEGGFEHVKVRQVRKTELFLKDASKNLIIIGAEMRSRLRLSDLPSIIEEKRAAGAKKNSKLGLALVVGNEENGLPDIIKDCCTALVRIPGSGNIESLNVAAAATLFLSKMYE